MKTISPTLPPDSVVLNAMNLAITHAQKLSKRAGIGWVLLDSENSHLFNGGVIAGADPWRLAANIERFREKIACLILTLEPMAGLVDQKKMIAAIENSKCDTLIIGKKIHTSFTPTYWQEWLKNWHGRVLYLSAAGTDPDLASGPQQVFVRNRPWVTCVSAADIYGNSMALSDLQQEFGVSAYLSELANQSRAVLYSAAQASIVDILPEENFAEENQEFFEVAEVGAVAAILQHCAAERRCSAVIFSDLQLLAQLVQENLVDEITHHIAIANHDCRDSVTVTPLPRLPLQGWQQISCAAAGNCTRIHLRADREIPPNNPPQHGLN